jgi:hypothetical protein
LKKLLSIIAALAFFFPQILSVLILAEFSINRDFIAKELCIQKEIPDNCCRGKCQLNDNLEKAGEKQNKGLPTVTVKFEINHFIPERESPAIKKDISLKAGKSFSKITTSTLPGVKPGVFHPPKLIF